MFKSLISSVSDEEFKKIVSESYSINEVGRKLGFINSPGSKSRKKINERIKNLNISLKEFSEKIEVKTSNESNYENTKDLGLVGEKYLEYICAKNSIPCLKPNGDNLPYDYIIIVNNNYYKIQVKTTEFDNDGKVNISNKHGNYYRNSNRKKYNEDDYNYLFVFLLSKEIPFLINTKNPSITISLKHSRNNQKKNIHYFEDYLFENVIKTL